MQMQEFVERLQNRYFLEYKLQCKIDAQRMYDEFSRWEIGDTIMLDLPLSEQATYADYVTRKMCKDQPNNIVVWMCKTSFNKLEGLDVKLNSAAIGNLALYLYTLNQMNGHDELKTQTTQKFNSLIEQQRVIKRNSLQ